jgi:hypothetical protein
MEMLGNPNTEPSYPENVRKKDKSLIPNEQDLSTYGDNQGVHFNPEEDALFTILKEQGTSPATVVMGSLDDPTQY